MADIASKLNADQIAELRREMATTGGVPVRILAGGRALDIVRGALDPKGINVIHQVHYWRFTRETAQKIALWLGATPVLAGGGVSPGNGG